MSPFAYKIQCLCVGVNTLYIVHAPIACSIFIAKLIVSCWQWDRWYTLYTYAWHALLKCTEMNPFHGIENWNESFVWVYMRFTAIVCVYMSFILLIFFFFSIFFYIETEMDSCLTGQEKDKCTIFDPVQSNLWLLVILSRVNIFSLYHKSSRSFQSSKLRWVRAITSKSNHEFFTLYLFFHQFALTSTFDSCETHIDLVVWAPLLSGVSIYEKANLQYHKWIWASMSPA